MMTTTPTPLLVPLVVDAFACTYPVLSQKFVTVRSWKPHPSATNGPREHDVPEALGGEETDIKDPERVGVFVHWRLPRALLTRAHLSDISGRAPDAGQPDLRGYRLVPNRWLVIRYARPTGQPPTGTTATGWIIHSDDLNPDSGNSIVFPHPTTTTGIKYGYPKVPYPKATFVGRRFDLSDPAEVTAEKTASGAAEQSGFLTALGPGLPAFAHFQPYNTNVFSFRDPAIDLFTHHDAPHTLSYLVMGWYSTAQEDPLAVAGKDLATLLATLGWAPPPGVPLARRSVYSGTVLGLNWYPYGKWKGAEMPPPPSRCPKDLSDIRIGLGDTVTESAAALLGTTDQAPLRAVLEAFAHGWLLDSDEPVTTADHNTRLHSTHFRTGTDPGYRWAVTDRPDTPPNAPQDTTAEQRILARLNADQYQYDTELQIYRELLHRLHDTWLLAGRPPEEAAAPYRELLDPHDPDSLLSRTTAQYHLLFSTDGLRDAIPWGPTPDKFDAAVVAYEEKVELPHRDHRHLVRTPLPAFHRPQTTALSIHGLSGDDDPAPPGPLPCRTQHDVITAIHEVADPGTSPCPTLPTTIPADVKDLIRPQVREFQLLDAARHTGPLSRLKPDQVTGHLPPYVRDWHQPWQPLFVRWRLQATPLPYRTSGKQHWNYQTETNRYHWKGKGDYTAPPDTGWNGKPIEGLNYLDPVHPTTLAGRAAQHATTFSSAPAAAAADDLRGIDVLTIPLEGMREWLLRRTPGRPLHPPMGTTPLEKALTAQLSGYSPPDSPRLANDHPVCTPVRAAQFTLHSLEVVDRFGRALSIISEETYQQFLRLDIADNLRVRPSGHLAQDENREITAELQPRLAPGARLRFDGIATHDDTTVIDPAQGWNPDIHPVCGWIMLSRLGRSLLCYAPTGHALGELRTVQRQGTRATVWQPLPDSPYRTLDTPAFARTLPHLHAFATALATQDVPALESLLAYIDQRLATITAPHTPTLDARHLALLLGRPLALLRTRLRLETDTFAPTDPRDPGHLSHPPGSTPPERWNIRLGCPGHTTDGLIGRLTPPGVTTAHLYVPDHQVTDPTGYLQPAVNDELTTRAHPITGSDLREHGDRAHPGTDLLITLLADPFAALHAHTGILPATPLALPARYLSQAFRSLTAAFPLGPLLAPAATGTPGEDGIVVPRPAWAGMRHWTQPPRPTTGHEQQPPSTWPRFTLTPYTTATAYNTPPPEAHSGYLEVTVPNDQP